MGNNMTDVLVTSKNKGKSAVPTIPKVAKAKGNVPTSDEFNAQVSAFNTLTAQLKANGIVK